MKKKDKEELINICEESFYRAMKRFMSEQKTEIVENDKEKVKRNKKDDILLICNVLFFPWLINKKLCINNKIYDGILVLAVSLLLELIGVVIWLIGAFVSCNKVVNLLSIGISLNTIEIIAIGLLIMMFGSLCFVSGKKFSEVTDSNKIYAYSASFLALISCIVAVVSLIKQCQ